MKHFKRFAVLFLLCVMSLLTVQGKIAHLLPRPQMLARETGSFMLSKPVRIVYGDDALQCPMLARFFQEEGAGVTDDASAPVVTVTNGRSPLVTFFDVSTRLATMQKLE